MSVVYDAPFREECLRHRTFADPKSAEIIGQLIAMLDVRQNRQIELYARATKLASHRGQVTGEKSEYFVTLEQLEMLLRL